MRNGGAAAPPPPVCLPVFIGWVRPWTFQLPWLPPSRTARVIRERSSSTPLRPSPRSSAAVTSASIWSALKTPSRGLVVMLISAKRARPFRGETTGHTVVRDRTLTHSMKHPRWPLVRLDHRPLHIGIVGLQAENRAADDRTPHHDPGGPRCLNSAGSATAGTCVPSWPSATSGRPPS